MKKFNVGIVGATGMVGSEIYDPSGKSSVV